MPRKKLPDTVKPDPKPPVDPNASPLVDDTPISFDEKEQKEEDNFQMRQLGEPILDEYPEGKNAEIVMAAHKPSETIVEHPLAPTDNNPNPHGTRDDPEFIVTERDPDTKVETRKPMDTTGGVEIEGLEAEGVHTGDGRVLAKGSRMTVSKEIAKALTEGKQAKRV